ncbi:MAG: alanine racemase [Candidatus Omnitrophica bacterium]|nr:alanine racemase [Candidatus Omnitrophota bacterium]
MTMRDNQETNHLALSWAEIDLKAVMHNLKELRRLASRNQFVLPSRPDAQKKRQAMDILAVIKADAYGHGMEEIGLLLQKQGVEFFGVSDVKEGIRLRQIGIRKPILLLEGPLPYFAKDIVDYHLMPTVCTLESARALNAYGQKVNKRIRIHIKVDTGMGRLGVWHEDAFDFIREIDKLKYLIVYGIYTHFPVADTDKDFTLRQIEILSQLVMRLDQKGLVIPYIHAGNSMGLSGYRTKVLNLARPGLMIYGLYPSESLMKQVKLKPVMSIKSKIIFIKKITKGRGVSYGQTFVAKHDMTIAILPIGYSDGYYRDFSNKAFVIVKGMRCPVVGNVTMDQIIVDISEVENPKLGMTVTILGKEGKASVTADDLGNWANTINYEIVCSLGHQLMKKYVS